MNETTLSKRIRVAVARSGRAIVTRNNIGLAIPYGRPGARPVGFGLGVGSPDLVGVLIPSGRAFCLEIKTETGRVSADQTRCHDAWRRRGIFVAVVRSVEDAMSALERAHQGESQ